MNHSWTTARRKTFLTVNRAIALVKPTRLQLYILRGFLNVLFICLLASISLFLVFDLFDRMNGFLKENASIGQVATYLFYKIPLIVQLTMPISVLLATLLSVGRLSQISEITAMRACGSSVFFLARPLLWAGLFISIFIFVSGETIVPAATQRVEETYHFDIKKKAEKGTFSRSNFWYRKGNTFYNIGLYDSRNATLKGISIIELNKNFKIDRRTDALEAVWGGSPNVGWEMHDAVEIAVGRKGDFNSSAFKKLPLVIDEQPEDFYNMERSAEAMSYQELKRYSDKLRAEGVPVTNYLVDLAAKISFPLVNFIVVLIAIPLALTPARSGSITMSIVGGLCVGFGYYVVHALSVSLGNAELIPVNAAAWTANIILGCVGAYLMAGAEFRH